MGQVTGLDLAKLFPQGLQVPIFKCLGLNLSLAAYGKTLSSDSQVSFTLVFHSDLQRSS